MSALLDKIAAIETLLADVKRLLAEQEQLRELAAQEACALLPVETFAKVFRWSPRKVLDSCETLGVEVYQVGAYRFLSPAAYYRATIERSTTSHTRSARALAALKRG